MARVLPAELVKVFVHVLRAPAQVAGQDLCGGGGGGQRDDAAAGGVPAGAGRAQCRGLARPGGSDGGDDSPVVSTERLGKLALPVIKAKPGVPFECGGRFAHESDRDVPSGVLAGAVDQVDLGVEQARVVYRSAA